MQLGSGPVPAEIDRILIQFSWQQASSPLWGGSNLDNVCSYFDCSLKKKKEFLSHFSAVGGSCPMEGTSTAAR